MKAKTFLSEDFCFIYQQQQAKHFKTQNLSVVSVAIFFGYIDRTQDPWQNSALFLQTQFQDENKFRKL